MVRRHRADLAWLATALGCAWLVWLYPLLLDRRHYFQGDTQNAYYGWLHHLGDALLHGHWPMLDVQTASAGNPLAEGQEGLYSPLAWSIGVGAAVAPQLVVYATLVKLLIVGIAVTGCYLLAREYGVRPGLAAVAATAVQLGGFTLSADGPRWIPGQIVAALLPWAWWGARRTISGAHPWPMLLSTFLLVTTGYVFGTMYLGLVLVGLLLEALLVRDWPGVRRLLLLGVYVALLCVVVYLPGILTGPVTWRDEWDVDGPGYLEMEPWTALLAGHPTTISPTVSELDEPALGIDQVTFTYVAWFLPLACWVVYARLRHEWRGLVSLVVPFALTLTWTLLPYRMGPIRMPGRVMAAVTLTAVLLVVVLLERALDSRADGRPGRARLALSLSWVAAGAAGATLLRPSSAALQVAAALAVTAGVVAAFVAAPRRRALPLVLLATSVGIAVLQLTTQQSGVGGERGSPGELAAYDRLLPGSRGDVLVIGLSPEVLAAHPDLGREILPGSLWDLTGKPVHNGYTPLGFRAYNGPFCIRFNGDVCPQALQRLLATEPTTGLPWVDLHSISTLVLVDLPVSQAHDPPRGWHVARDEPPVVTWVRDTPLPTAGGVTWASPGTRVDVVSQSETITTFRVEEVGPDPSVVLSRIAWPGYEVEGAAVMDPLGGHLLRLRLPSDAAGSTVTVRFRPPGWRWEVTALLAAIALAVAWSALTWRRRRAASGPQPSQPAGRDFLGSLETTRR
ncbi:hypothetical protein GON03_21100 [Nocardioides sp. MAH-18]|uniref:YfhO family protein n=1 Tax=Nocardioides agri TaxID=2682843 RepID=A0A6L6Y258_9ACTN|nr:MULTISPECIES: hypothetical protein [unclassified Nocardioides]MBA2952522.1 hypothetical protein [Nocardioides sp. CGMCC 1.13656]MVQ51685.1 hypothetical protein [Nocardioides sp. MAH-18]